METVRSLARASGRIAPKPFALGAAAVYGASFASQVLISPPIWARGGLYGFAVLQIALAFAWYALHAGRLRDAGRPVGAARAIAVLYALAIVLLVLLVEPILGGDASTVGPQARRHDWYDLWVFLLLLAALTAQPDPGFFYVLSLAILALILTPIAIAIGFSVWAGTRARSDRPSAAA
jgi:hypothetical protein